MYNEPTQYLTHNIVDSYNQFIASTMVSRIPSPLLIAHRYWHSLPFVVCVFVCMWGWFACCRSTIYYIFVFLPNTAITNEATAMAFVRKRSVGIGGQGKIHRNSGHNIIMIIIIIIAMEMKIGEWPHIHTNIYTYKYVYNCIYTSEEEKFT